MIVNNCHADVYKWIESNINSCKNYQQTLAVDKLIDQFEIMYNGKLPAHVISDLARILRRQISDKWLSFGILSN